MSSLFSSGGGFGTVSNGSSLGGSLDSLTLREITVTDLTILGALHLEGTIDFGPIEVKHVGGIVTTTDAAMSVLYSLPTTIGAIHYYEARIIAISSSNNTGTLRMFERAKNISGVVSTGTQYDNWVDVEPALVGVSIAWAINGTNMDLQVFGVNGQTIKWRGVITESATTYA